MTPAHKLANTVSRNEDNFRVLAVVSALIGLIPLWLWKNNPSGSYEAIFTLFFGIIVPLLWNLRSLVDWLLGIRSGGLSLEPIDRREAIGKILGREDDVNWLWDTQGDLIVVAQPGCGKTFLLREYVKRGGGLFAIADDRDLLADSIRREAPRAVIVDDAHYNKQRLLTILQIRKELDVAFRIISTSWPNEEDELRELLGVPSTSIRHLRLLSRNEIVQIIKNLGLIGPNELIRELVDQSQGRAGLAVTLTKVCLDQGVQEIALGDALARNTKTTFAPRVGDESIPILSAFAIGGDAGLTLDCVANGLVVSPIDVQRIVTQLGAGGVLSQVGQDRLSVQPHTLRYSLVRDTFFCGPASLNAKDLMSCAQNSDDLALTLIGARSRGATVANELLKPLIEKSSSRVWSPWCWLGHDESSWYLERFPDNIVKVAFPLLEYIPDNVIPRLLNKSIGDYRETNSTLDHPLRIIEDWITTAKPGTNAAVSRRTNLATIAAQWAGQKNDTEISLRALGLAMSPKFQETSADPGAGNTIIWSRGHLLLAEIKALEGFWSKVEYIMNKSGFDKWFAVLKIVEEWAYPERLDTGKGASSEVAEEMLSFTKVMLNSILRLDSKNNGLLHRISEISDHVGADINVEIDSDFMVLFPFSNFEDYDNVKRVWTENAVRLANKWRDLSPTVFAQKISHYESQAKDASLTYPRFTSFVSEQLVPLISDHLQHAQELVNAGCNCDVVLPFLKEAALRNMKGWCDLAKGCLLSDQLRYCGVVTILTIDSSPEDLKDEALSNLDESYDGWVRTACKHESLPLDIMQKLLKHDKKEIACAAGIGIWELWQQNDIPAQMHGDWKQAILKCDHEDYLLENILSEDKYLAYEWLKNYVSKQFITIYRKEDLFHKIVDRLTDEQKWEILRSIPKDVYLTEDLIKIIINGNLSLYSRMLADKSLSRYHLLVLSGGPNEQLMEQAILALDNGYSIHEVADAINQTAWLTSINRQLMWDNWIDGLELLVNWPDQRINEVVSICIEFAQRKKNEVIEKQKMEEVFGVR